jgi:hypothetical protein
MEGYCNLCLNNNSMVEEMFGREFYWIEQIGFSAEMITALLN